MPKLFFALMLKIKAIGSNPAVGSFSIFWLQLLASVAAAGKGDRTMSEMCAPKLTSPATSLTKDTTMISSTV
jgi:hypothetical protein